MLGTSAGSSHRQQQTDRQAGRPETIGRLEPASQFIHSSSCCVRVGVKTSTTTSEDRQQAAAW